MDIAPGRFEGQHAVLVWDGKFEGIALGFPDITPGRRFYSDHFFKKNPLD
jgi:hypothetical protein